MLLRCLAATALSNPAPEVFTHVWRADDGLPQNAVTAIVQAREGYLWLGTYGGLVRFDGVQFTVFDSSNTPELQSSRVTSLFEDAEGRLWIGHETGKLTVRERGRFRPVEVPVAWPAGKVLALGTDEVGDLWLVSEEGLLMRASDGLKLTPEAGPAARTVAFTRNAIGETWIGREGRVSALKRGALVTVDFGAESPGAFVQGICASRQGGLWVASEGRLRRWQESRWAEDRGEMPWGSMAIVPLIELRNGSLAGGTTDAGLYLVTPERQVLNVNRTNGLPQNWVRSLCEDREGNLWAGVGSGGLVALRAGKVSLPSPPDHWQGRSVLSVSVGRNGAVWVGTEGAGLYRFRAGDWRHFGLEDGLSHQFVWTVSEDAGGRLWAGTWGGGVFVQSGDRFVRPAGLEELTVPTTALLHLPTGVTWIGSGDGLLRYEAGQVTKYGRNEGLELPDVRAILQAADGTIWFGMAGGGLGSLKDGRLQQYRKRDGLSSDYVQCLWLDSEGALWLGTAGDGLIRLKRGRFATISTRHGFPNNVICHLAEDARGHLWISSHGGILRISMAALNRCADTGMNLTDCLAYGKGEGLPTLECSGGLQPAGCQTQDGRLWFPTSQGLVVVNPEHVKMNELPPPVMIEEVRVGSRFVAGDPVFPAPLRMAPGQQRFEFRYTGLSFTVPEKVRFRFRLEGLETEWTEGGTERSAVYRYIPPGDYTFRVTACNNDGIWNEAGAAVAFTVLPRFWQTWYFRLPAGFGSAVAVAGSVWFMARRRLHRKLERLERQQAVERERARIAKDIHDDLGASLTRITLLSQSARAELDERAAAAEDLDRIYTTARELTRAMDEIVWAVNPQHDTLDSLATYLGRFAQGFLAAAHVRCRLDVPIRLPAWPLTAETRHNLFLAFKEALHNAVKHAAPAEVRISLVIEPEAFVLQVEDQGRGFCPTESTGPPETSRIMTGNGLVNMRQRLLEIGGRLEIQSVPGQGTKVTFLVPVRAPAK